MSRFARSGAVLTVTSLQGLLLLDMVMNGYFAGCDIL